MEAIVLEETISARRADHSPGGLLRSGGLYERNSPRDVGSTLTPTQINETAANLQLREGLPAFPAPRQGMKQPAFRLPAPFL
jgi:hypothetical protein